MAAAPEYLALGPIVRSVCSEINNKTRRGGAGERFDGCRRAGRQLFVMTSRWPSGDNHRKRAASKKVAFLSQSALKRRATLHIYKYNRLQRPLGQRRQRRNSYLGKSSSARIETALRPHPFSSAPPPHENSVDSGNIPSCRFPRRNSIPTATGRICSPLLHNPKSCKCPLNNRPLRRNSKIRARRPAHALAFREALDFRCSASRLVCGSEVCLRGLGKYLKGWT